MPVASVSSADQSAHFVQPDAGRGRDDIVDKENGVDVLFGHEPGKRHIGVVPVVDDIDIFIGVDQEGNKGIAEGFLDHHNGRAVAL